MTELKINIIFLDKLPIGILGDVIKNSIEIEKFK